MGLGLDWLLSQHTLDRRDGDAVSPGDLADALALTTVALDGGMVEYQRQAVDALTFQTSAPHAGAHPLDDQAAFEFGDGADDDHDGPAQRAGCVDFFPEADVLDSNAVLVVFAWVRMLTIGNGLGGRVVSDPKPARRKV